MMGSTVPDMRPMYDLNGKASLVTGGAQGIGFGIARELAKVGSFVILADRELSLARAAADQISAIGQGALALSLDVASEESVRRCVAQAIEQCGHLNILINNAGIFQNRLGLELENEDFMRCMDVNVIGIWRMVTALVPHFLVQGGGRIINIASVGGRRGVDFAPAYCASKAAVINLTQSLAAALGSANINVNTVCPGTISTAMQNEIRALRSTASLATNREPPTLPLKGPLTPEDIGRAVVFFASDYARSITGQALNVDCGHTMS